MECRASDKQRRAVSRPALLTERTAQLLCVDINEGFCRGLGGGRGSILATQRNPDLHGSCCLGRHEQNSSVLRHTVHDVFRSRSALKGKGTRNLNPEVAADGWDTFCFKCPF